MELKMTYLAVGAIRPNPANPRKHPRKQLDQLKRSITAFGFTNPLLIDKHNYVICGHGRYTAAQELGLETLPVIRLPGLSEGQAAALSIADNKIAQSAVWDAELLKVELERISVLEISFALEVTGFASAEIDILLDANQGLDPADDTIPEVPNQPVTKRGRHLELGTTQDWLWRCC